MASILDRKKNMKPATPKKTREDYAEDALYREVWEDVNNEKTIAFFKKYSISFRYLKEAYALPGSFLVNELLLRDTKSVFAHIAQIKWKWR